MFHSVMQLLRMIALESAPLRGTCRTLLWQPFAITKNSYHWRRLYSQMWICWLTFASGCRSISIWGNKRHAKCLPHHSTDMSLFSRKSRAVSTLG